MSLFLPKTPTVLSVSELNRHAKAVLEQTFPLLWVGGEISNFTRATSGHWYFTLKDGQAQVRCAMFRHKSQYVDFRPENGMHVEVRALVTLYEARGEYQLSVESMRRAGLGALFEAFEKLKAKLAAEGLFEETRKQALPVFPRCIGIVTSPAAAALRDVLTTLRRRMPNIPVVLYPTPVQGEGAGQKIAQALQLADSRNECDVLILCRGGGSIEDLWAFNEEVVARAIAASSIPVISGVGHETDITIADFVADRRAPTPTAAAELATPHRADLHQRLDALHARLSRQTSRSLEQRMQQLDYLARRLVHPGTRIEAQLQHLNHLRQRQQQAASRALEQQEWRVQRLASRLARSAPAPQLLQAQQQQLGQRLELAMGQLLQHRQATLQRLAASLQHLNPEAVLERGFSMVRSASGKLVRSSADIALHEELSITFAHGSANASVTRKEEAT
ncbi:exodeoxyribonuclease 7 large subunit [Sulfurimicrobium lacus]|uniref:Exodeoxyribonuclease 7 large subunit n=1 Tax=Sulfurimicrobium lacus TaxID=2715678 RepID=A0A6F8VBA5_9PROT|nr:exodeoxyribonuclease VII large subunit [Sulfurimicrobium lacus]BCB26286.1 exodeoxyribonuclease 7 large subunit [Sulfurimicrobium lacus]